MARVITMPKFGLTMETGKVTAWLKHPGDRVEKGELLAEIETDKITTEFESPESGYLLKVIVEEGSEARVKEPICLIGKEGETTDLATVAGQPSPSPSGQEQGTGLATIGGALASEAPAIAGIASRRLEGPTISPRARKLMAEKAIDPSAFQSLKKERITESDVQKYLRELPSAPPSSPVLAEAFENGRLTGIRKRIAERMSRSKKTIPHFYLRAAVDATAMISMHRTLLFKPAYNDMIIKACAMAMVEFPDVNVSLVDNVISKHHNCNIGLAVSLDNGLIVPVVHGAQTRSLEAISALTTDLIARARAGKLGRDEVTGGTFTVTSLGAHPIEEFNAIINPPESAILAVGRILSQPVVVGQQVVPGHVVKLTLSVDHQIIDGMLAAEFLSRIKELLEVGDPLGN